jgi:hypothetical protein
MTNGSSRVWFGVVYKEWAEERTNSTWLMILHGAYEGWRKLRFFPPHTPNGKSGGWGWKKKMKIKLGTEVC